MKKLHILLLLSVVIFFSSCATQVDTKETLNQERNKKMVLRIEMLNNSSMEELIEKKYLFVQYVKRLHNEDNSDYLLCKLLSPVTGKEQITYLVVGGRFENQLIKKGIKNLTVNIAYVTNNSLLDEDYMDFSKGEFVGFGKATDDTKNW